MVDDIAGIAAGRKAYLDAANKELAVCPHCKTWLEQECLSGNGCPTVDGRNGDAIRALKEGSDNG